MSKSFMYKGRESYRKLICFSQDTKSFVIDKDAPIHGLNTVDEIESAYRQLNSEMRSNVIQDLVKFWTTAPAVKFRYLLISFQKYISSESSKFNGDEKFRGTVLNLFLALFQQLMVEIGPEIKDKRPIAQVLRVNQIQNSENLIKALKEFDIPYQKSLISQTSMGFVSKNISEASFDGYKSVVEELVNLLTINIK